jgi:membrane protease YdiL (CAAX protease family)
MTGATPIQLETVGSGRPGGSFAQRHPITAFLVLALGIGWVGLSIPLLLGIPMAPFLLVMVLVALLGSALLVTRLADGPGAVRKLLSRLLIWRFSLVRWAVILFGMPVLTLAIAAVSGTLHTPEGGWMRMFGLYLFSTLIFGTLIIQLWEETAWAGFVQSRLMARHGLLIASLLTAVPFAAIHIPLQFEGDPAWSQIWMGLLILFAAAPIYRYLLGMHLLDTGGSLLAVAIQHASWNAAQKLEAVEGGTWNWQVIAALVVLTACVAVGRRVWRPERHPIGTDAEKAAAAEWVAAPSPHAANGVSSATERTAT